MKPLSEQVSEGAFLSYMETSPLDGQQRQLVHHFLKTSSHPLEFLHKTVSLRMPQSLIDYTADALALASAAARRSK